MNFILQKTSSKIDSLQAIRAFAAIAVMIFHGTLILHNKFSYMFLNDIFMSGFSGVDVFFVLSGFIILHTSSSGKNNISNFIKKRFFRIYPIYWVVTSLYITLFLISPSAGKTFNFDPSFILGSYALIPQKQYVVGVAWTLTYEVIFYFVFAVTYFRNPRLLFYALAFWGCAILVFQFLNIKTGIFAIDSLTNPIILEFSFGCLVAYIYKRYSSFTYSGWFFWGGLLLFILMWSIYYKTILLDPRLLDPRLLEPSVFSGNMARVYLFGIPASFLIFGALYLPLTVPRLLVYLGDASYSVYLVHGLVLSSLIKVVEMLNYGTLLGSFLGAITLFICTLAISCLFYSLVERRLLKLLNRPIKLGPPTGNIPLL